MIVVRAPGVGERRLPLADRLIVGRAAGCDVRLRDAEVSRRHCRILRRGEAVQLDDLDSANGTFVNGRRVRSCTIGAGDRIRVGQASLWLDDGEPAATPLRDVGPRASQATQDEDGERTALLLHVGRAVLSAGSIDALAHTALSLLFECVHAERGALLLRDGDGPLVPRLAYHRDRGPLAADAFAVPDAVLSEALDAGAAVLADTALAAPLRNGDRVLGVLYLDASQPGGFGHRDLYLASAIGNLVAIRLEQERLHEELTQVQVLRSNLERYHSPQVVEAILERVGRDGQEFGLEEREASVLFADIQGFTELCARVAPGEVAAFLNRYLEIATRHIFENGGSVNDFVGDSVMAIFGAPVSHKDHALRCVRAAVGIQRELARWQRDELAKPDAERLCCRVRMGINSGPVVVGNIGSRRHLKYTVLGDTVNVAARLEKVGEAGTITLGERTHAGIRHRVLCEPLGERDVRGRIARLYRLGPPFEGVP